MPRKSLRPHLNQIRAWVRQGRTDAWVAHQLEVSVRDIEQFKRQNELAVDGDAVDGAAASDYEDIDLRAEDDALIAAELEAAEAEAERARAQAETEREKAREQHGDDDENGDGDGDGNGNGDGDGDGEARTRRRGRRGGRGRRSSSRNTGPLEGTFDHGEEGYGLWMDPAIQENPIYAEHWAGHRPVEVEVQEDRIVIRRVGEDDD